MPVQPLLPVANERGSQALTPPHDTLLKRTGRTIDWYARRGYADSGERRPFPYGQDSVGVPRDDDLRFVVLVKHLT